MVCMVDQLHATVAVDGVRCQVWQGWDEEGHQVILFVRASTWDVEGVHEALAETARTGLTAEVGTVTGEEVRYGLPR